ncbi:hypothetical protein TRAPUB_3679 [Trametes pubescens]|uniref:Uncharacterized protein n=1 Tax=Trametes pubescens TaxID=154538 RepID=A0A1M2VCW5_TRAPU|nr:hypothetical protein TRAPUB_3679 [Trametes pubescens]
MGEDDGQEGDPGSPTGYISDSIKFISSEGCDERKDIVSLIVFGGDREIAHTILGPSRKITEELTESARLGDCTGRRVLSVAGTESNDGSVETPSSNSEGAMHKELIDKDYMVDTLDGIQGNIPARGKSVGSNDGVAALGSNEMMDDVEVSSSDADDDSDLSDDGLTSVIGVSIESSHAIDGDARSVDDS